MTFAAKSVKASLVFIYHPRFPEVFYFPFANAPAWCSLDSLHSHLVARIKCGKKEKGLTKFFLGLLYVYGGWRLAYKPIAVYCTSSGKIGRTRISYAIQSSKIKDAPAVRWAHITHPKMLMDGE